MKERELAIKEKELELQKQQNGGTTAGDDKVTTGNITVPPSDRGDVQGTITGEGVVLRQMNTTESAKMGSLKKGDKVTIKEQTRPENQNQAITAKEVKLYNDYNGKYMATLNKGKALKIESFDGSMYKVSYMHPEMGKLYATVAPSELETISNEPWYKVRTADGKEGWVLGKFVKK